ncbi:hypothetical protein AJ80_07541 [Polytolypa hystricis UAMH7299]|uniref:Uncharacterized protein n=1 Tax=Polytolypa hystricis (strain UAMH7299) TaxID=1447883 RepID=A0A2B7XNF2_POLH7|nr:hypothetical protein AJ80_07541 [Polytolypa hystricis UAMH7299]
MAQGEIKKKAPATAKKSSVLRTTKKGARSIAPKNSQLIKHKKMNKKFAAGLTARTERSLAEKAGHLELLAGGKKANKADKAGKKDGTKR